MKKKHTISLLVTFTIALLLLFGACTTPAPEATPAETPAATEPAPASTPAPTPTPAPAPASTPAPASATTPAAAEEPIELLVNFTLPDVVPYGQLCKAWSDKITEMSDGRVQFTWHWMSSLIQGSGDIKKSLKAGICDVSQYPMGFEEGMYLHDFARLTFLGLPSTAVGTEIYMELLNSTPELKDELGGIQIFGAYMMPTAHIHMTDKLAKTPADIEGTKLIALGNMAKLAEAAGAAPVELMFNDFYMSLERGVVQGIIEHFPACDAAGIIPLTPYHTILGEGGIAMNLQSMGVAPDTWNNLPPDIQEIFIEVDSWFVEEGIKLDVGLAEGAIANAKEMGQTVEYLTPEEIQPWSDLCQPLHEEWIEETEARGLPARALYDEVQRLLEAY